MEEDESMLNLLSSYPSSVPLPSSWFLQIYLIIFNYNQMKYLLKFPAKAVKMTFSLQSDKYLVPKHYHYNILSLVYAGGHRGQRWAFLGWLGGRTSIQNW